MLTKVTTLGFDALNKAIKAAGLKSQTHTDELICLYDLTLAALRRDNALIVELGTAGGISAMVIAQAVLDKGNAARIVSVDNYSEGGSIQNSQATIEQFGFGNVITLVDGDDLAYLRSCKQRSIRELFVDSLHSGSHVWETFRTALPKLEPLAILCGHDYTPREPGVVQAVERLKRDYREAFFGFGLHRSLWWTMKGKL